MLRLLFLALVIYFVLRMVRRVVAALLPRSPGASSSEGSSSTHAPGGQGSVIDEMKRCPTCGTYNPTRLAYRKKDLYFCGERCHEDFHHGKPSS